MREKFITHANFTNLTKVMLAICAMRDQRAIARDMLMIYRPVAVTPIARDSARLETGGTEGDECTRQVQRRTHEPDLRRQPRLQRA